MITTLQHLLNTPDLLSFCNDDFILNKYDLNNTYLDRMDRTIENALNEHPRTLAVRVDLRLPLIRLNDELDRDLPNIYRYDRSNLITKFINSFKAKIKADLNRKYKSRKRVHPCTPRYIWCRERDTSINEHFHMLLLLNKDTYHGLGCYQREGNLSSMVNSAWASALDCIGDEIGRLVHFPENCCYHINKNSDDYNQQLEDLFRRVSYLAKKRTKCYGEGHRTFGTSSR
ncbi:MAG: hypothetical protein ACI935_000651 [Moritella dasanensis]|jgi:hypothetical protein